MAVGMYLEAARRLHQHLVNVHWDGRAIVGPDPIGRINWRITRFIRSYTSWLPWKDSLVYLQGQGYWIRANSRLHELTGSSHYLDILGQSADYIVQKQLDNGAWEHPPIRERRGFVSAVETVWACLGLIAAHQKSGNPTYLDTALRGYDALFNVIGFRRLNDSLALNYYAHSRSLVPNVSTMFLWLVAELQQATGHPRYLDNSEEIIRFIASCQMESGELMYAQGVRAHFQCYQYNSFEFIDLAHYYQITGHEGVRHILSKMAAYLATGLTERSSSRYSCFKEVPEEHYWTAVLAAALRQANELGLGNYRSHSERAFRYLLTQQKPNGAFDFSTRNYGLLHDRRSYPRYLAMIMCHLLDRAQADTTGALESTQDPKQQPWSP